MANDQTENHDETGSEPEVVEKSITVNTEPAVVVEKKSGGGFSLLISLVALGVAGFLFYQDWMGKTNKSSADNIQPLLNQIQQEQQRFSADLKQFQESSQSMKQQFAQSQQQLARLQKETTEFQTSIDQSQPGDKSAFDNTANEAALQQLESDLLSQAKIIKSLERQLANQPMGQAPQNQASGVVEQLRVGAAMQTLMGTQILLATGQVESAVGNLNGYLVSAKINEKLKNKMRAIANRLEQLKPIDTSSVRKELQTLVGAVDDIKLPITTVAEETKWYDRFVSVKKISDVGSVNSSIRLAELKLQLSRLLHHAGVYLTMQNEAAWQDTVAQAAVQLEQQMPQEQALVGRLKALVQQKIKTEIPVDLGMAELMAELEGLQP